MREISHREVYALVDINNCYVSCERLFNPKLNDKPVVVLSNNDGCVVSRSEEAKLLGIKMGVPWFQIEKDALKAGVQVYSSNYTLYAEMSRRFFAVLGDFFSRDDLEAYSIDECFIHLTPYLQSIDISDYCSEVRNTLLKWLGLPCCIGIGYSKTQAKLANHYAKKIKSFRGICNFITLDPLIMEDLMQHTSVKEVWGIGYQLVKQLQSYEVYSCLDLTFANEHHMAKAFSVVMARTIRELKGQSCIQLDDPAIPTKRILASRSFAQALSSIEIIKQALIFHLNRAHRRLMKQEQLCSCIQVMLYEKIDKPPYKKAISQAIGLHYATDDLCILTKAAMQQIDVLYKENKSYIKIGVLFCGLHARQQHIDDLWQPLELIHQRQQLMETLGTVRKRFGSHYLQVGYHSRNPSWQMKQCHRSKNYLTRWNEMLTIEDAHDLVTQNT
ncbi:Y-family DNA polymerase [Acinetobacter nosocomialis]|uniref:Y-family DNA polymerase n=1 Tax=Acinetobacter nosocomialis TaxID=106654 RepID=UPI003AF7047A